MAGGHLLSVSHDMRQLHAKGLIAIVVFDTNVDIQKLVVNYAFDWHLLIQGPIKRFVYKLSCEFQHEPLDFIVKFETKYTIFRKMFYD